LTPPPGSGSPDADPCDAPLISVVVPTSGRADLLRTALSSLADPDAPAAEVIVVDSGPPDGVHAACAASPLPTRLRRLDRPAGFAAAVNAGIELARGRYVLVLNNDVRAAPGFLAALAATARTSGAQLVVPRVLSLREPDRIDNTGNTLLADGLNLCRDRGAEDGPQHRTPVDPLLPSGSAMLLDRALLTRIGGFDEGFFAYGEDAELGLRALEAGVAPRYAPDAVVHHLGGGTWGPRSLRKAYLVERNRARLAVAHLPSSWLPGLPLRVAVRYLHHARSAADGGGPLGSYGGVARRCGAALAAGAALVSSLGGLPADLRRRGRVRAQASVADGELADVLSRRVVDAAEITRKRPW